GNFPVPFSEWNGKFRDAMRSFWRGDEGFIGEVAYRLTGSPDLYQHDGRRPYASVNFITSHDGYTLNDLVSYNGKHNDANGDVNPIRLLEFTRKLIQLRREHAVFRRPRFFQGRRVRGGEIKDVMWFNPGGNEMSEEEWDSPFVRCLGMLISGDAADLIDLHGDPVRDDAFLLLINAHHEPIPFLLPGEEHLDWEQILDTTNEDGFLKQPTNFSSGDDVDLNERTTYLF